MTRPYPTVEILGVPLASLDVAAALREIERLYDEGPALVFYANAHTLNLASRDEGYRELLRKADIVLNDGSGVSIAARLARHRFPANLNGSDLNLLVAGLAAEKGWSLYLLGAAEGVAAQAAQALVARWPDLRIAGCSSGYFEPSQSSLMAAAVRASGADVLMVAMGNPLQERWLDEHLEATGARLGIGVGAFFDFTAGRLRRAPAWMNRAGVEWLWRLGHEPTRLWRRYIVGNPVFLARVLKERFRSDGRS